jgi:hypothetical protein
VLSVVVSVFMLGLALGSWLGGRWNREFDQPRLHRDSCLRRGGRGSSGWARF